MVVGYEAEAADRRTVSAFGVPGLDGEAVCLHSLAEQVVGYSVTVTSGC